MTEEKRTNADTKRVHTYPLIRHSDMNDEMKNEAMELCVMACEKFASNNESAAKMIKEAMDKKFGVSWHAVVGENYGFEVTHELKNLLYMFFGDSVKRCDEIKRLENAKEENTTAADKEEIESL